MRLNKNSRNELNKIKRFWYKVTGRRQLSIEEFDNRMMDLADGNHEAFRVGKVRLEHILSQTTVKVIIKHSFSTKDCNIFQI